MAIDEETMKLRPQTVFIVGYGRSGSTLLDRLLGLMPDCISIGEIRNIWTRGFAQDQLCGCGEPFSRCEFWSAVIRETFGGRSVDLSRIQQLRKECYELKTVEAQNGMRVAELNPRQVEFLDIWRQIYDAVRKVSGAQTVIDSSKDPLHCYLLSGSGGNRTAYVHLVRDSRGCTYSRTRPKPRPEIHWKDVSMGTRGLFHTTLNWNRVNNLVDHMGVNIPTTRLRYEDLTSSPSESLADLCDWLGIRYEPILDGKEATVVNLPVNHTVSGNPGRFNTGFTEVRPDDEWKTKMSYSKRLMVLLLTYRRMKAYGYC